MDAITKYTTINAWDMRRVVLNKPRKLGWVARRSTNLPVLWVMDTVVRGAVFLALQVFEYATADFRITDSIFGGLLYSLTGLHGFHVLVGLICLGCFVSYSLSQFVPLKLY
jgi:heme/copper-type cytochrome/quinol oxidase subunit 3